MTKKELVKIISKKAAVIDTSAKELFDLFLQKLSVELQAGESAQFSNVGHFHFRKAKVKKESADSEQNRIEYLDLIIFSPSEQLDIKSAGNLVFNVPDMPSSRENDLDAHFSLSVGKPVLPNLEGSNSAVYSTDELQEILNRKVESLMVNLRKDESAFADSEVLLIDIKSIDQDQFELELDEQAKLKNSEKADNAIHSSEQLKSIAWSFGKDLSNQLSSDELIAKETGRNLKSEISEFNNKAWEEPTSDLVAKNETDISDAKEISTDKLTEEQPESEADEKPISFPVKKNGEDVQFSKITGEESAGEFNPFNANTDSSEKTFDLTEITDDETVNLSELKVEDSIDAVEFAKSLLDEVDIKDLDIEMDDFEVSNNDEKMGKFERVRSISSSYNEFKSIKEIEGFDSFISDKINVSKNSVVNKNVNKDNADKDFNSEEPEADDKAEKQGKEKKKLILNKTEPKEIHNNYNRKNSTSKFLIIIALMAGVVAIIYLLTNNSNNSQVTDEMVIPLTGSTNTTYIERTYDIPVNYPYDKPDDELKIVGLVQSDKIIENKSQENVVESKEPVQVVTQNQEASTNSSGSKPAGDPVQVAYSIYQYGNTFIVQVAAFRSELTANQEVSKFTSLGYNAFLEQVAIDGVLWYRVRVGNFDSIEKAKNFRTSQQ